MRQLIYVLALGTVLSSVPAFAQGQQKDANTQRAINKALEYLARTQRRQGYWEANSGQYRVAMTALAGTALLCEGSTTTTGKYADNIRRAVDYLVERARPNGLIGYENDNHYTYGHGYSMLFLSQVYGEEEDAERRNDLKRVLTNAVKFCADAQTSRGGWGYVSAKDGNDFDEGSTCITQIQGLRACRNAGIPVPVSIIDRAKKYIYDCMMSDGGLRYSYMTQSGTRPPITAAAVAGMFNAGEYDSPEVKKMLEYCKINVWPGRGNGNDGGHWHYMHYYWAQVMYRQGDEKWRQYWNDIGQDIIKKQSPSGEWVEGYVGPVYTTAINATILQLDNGFLPIYQR
jgi:hypothetical protein